MSQTLFPEIFITLSISEHFGLQNGGYTYGKMIHCVHNLHTNSLTLAFRKNLGQENLWGNKMSELLYLQLSAKVLSEKMVSTHWASPSLQSVEDWPCRLCSELISRSRKVLCPITRSSFHCHCGQSGEAGAANSGLTIYSASHIKCVRSNPIQHVLIFISPPDINILKCTKRSKDVSHEASTNFSRKGFMVVVVPPWKEPHRIFNVSNLAMTSICLESLLAVSCWDWRSVMSCSLAVGDLSKASQWRPIMWNCHSFWLSNYLCFALLDFINCNSWGNLRLCLCQCSPVLSTVYSEVQETGDVLPDGDLWLRLVQWL